MQMSPEPAYHHGTLNQTGILLINLGTPEAPTAEALRPYLKQFLSNQRVVEMPSWLWWPILNVIILNTRPKESAKKYAQVWMPEGSPLKVHTERQTHLLRDLLGRRLHPEPMVEYAMMNKVLKRLLLAVSLCCLVTTANAAPIDDATAAYDKGATHNP